MSAVAALAAALHDLRGVTVTGDEDTARAIVAALERRGWRIVGEETGPAMAVARAIFDARCPGIRWSDNDVPLYLDAAQAAIDSMATPTPNPPAERKPCEGWVDGTASSVLRIFGEVEARVYREASTLRWRWYIDSGRRQPQPPSDDAYATDETAAKLAAEDAADALLVEARRRLGRV